MLFIECVNWEKASDEQATPHTVGILNRKF